jgi:hypothetical protein
LSAEDRRSLLYAALACTRVKSTETRDPDSRTWLDSWSGLGAIVVGMLRYGYDLSLTGDKHGWRATTFLRRSHLMQPWVGQVLTWWPTPWRAVQEGAWCTLNTPFAEDHSVSEETPR